MIARAPHQTYHGLARRSVQKPAKSDQVVVLHSDTVRFLLHLPRFASGSGKSDMQDARYSHFAASCFAMRSGVLVKAGLANKKHQRICSSQNLLL